MDCREAGKLVSAYIDGTLPDAKLVRVTIAHLPGCRDDVVFVGLNGAGFYFLRGRQVSMPEPVKEILVNTGVLG